MGLGYCPECGKLYAENAAGMCPACHARELEDEDKVTEYLNTVSKATLDEIHEATGVKHKTVLRMMKRGRIVGNGQIVYNCESCGAPITEGRLCAKCGKEITDQLKHQVEDWRPPERLETERPERRMYTAELLRKK